jgi:hypothetical protein
MVFPDIGGGLGRRIKRGIRNRRARRRRPGSRRVPVWLPRAVLACLLLGIAFGPVSGTTAGPQAAACQGPACKQARSAQRWVRPMGGTWAVGSGLTGTFPASGQAYVAVGNGGAGNGVVVVADGLTVSAYALSNGAPLWQSTLTGFQPGSAIMSVRAWPGVITAGVASPAGKSRTEVVIDNVTGVVVRHYPSALFGGAVTASTNITTIVGQTSVTSYDNRTGDVRWRRPAGPGQAWRADGATLYLAETSGGYLGGAQVMGLQVIDLVSGSERTLGSPPANPFTGSLAEAFSGVVMFTSASGVTAYDGSTGRLLWSMGGVVPEGTDPAQSVAYFASDTGALLGVDPITGQVRRYVSGAAAVGSADIYVVRDGVALGLDNGSGGEARGYSLAAGRVTWTVPGLSWPHYFADVSGIGGSAAQSGDIVVIAACQGLAPASQATQPTPTPTPTLTSTPTPSTVPSTSPTAKISGRRVAGARRGKSPTPSRAATPPPTETLGPSTSPTPSPTPTPTPPQLCATPVLVALSL